MGTVRSDVMAKRKKIKKDRYEREKRKSVILYVISAVVILVPLGLLGYIYLGAKESSGKPTTGERFSNSLEPSITEEQINQITTALQGDGVDKVEITLKSATLRVLVDVSDTANNDVVNETISSTYNKIAEILPVKTYFTNKEDGSKMYDLDIHVYNFIPTEGQATDTWIYKERVKNASSKEMVTDTLSSPKDQEEADRLLEDHTVEEQAE